MLASYNIDTQIEKATADRGLGTSSFFMLFQEVFSLWIAFSASLEGSVIKMKPATLAPQDTAVTLKA